MRGNKSAIPDFDDLVFESRNKDYGAFQLRKKYKSAVFQGLIISSAIGCSAVLIPFLINSHSDHVFTGGSRFITVNVENMMFPAEEHYVPPPLPSVKSRKPQENINSVIPDIVDSVFPMEKTMPATDEVLATSGDSSLNASLTGPGNDLLNGTGDTDLTEPLFIVEVMPSFHGGDETKFHDWVQKRTIYPQEASDNNIRGTVILTFVVEKDGSVGEINIVKGVHPLLDSVAIKVVSASPKWSPGLQRGQPVRVRFLIPIMFSK
jgi:periplasmic protein TonB